MFPFSGYCSTSINLRESYANLIPPKLPTRVCSSFLLMLGFLKEFNRLSLALNINIRSLPGSAWDNKWRSFHWTCHLGVWERWRQGDFLFAKLFCLLKSTNNGSLVENGLLGNVFDWEKISRTMCASLLLFIELGNCHLCDIVSLVIGWDYLNNVCRIFLCLIEIRRIDMYHHFYKSQNYQQSKGDDVKEVENIFVFCIVQYFHRFQSFAKERFWFLKKIYS